VRIVMSLEWANLEPNPCEVAIGAWHAIG